MQLEEFLDRLEGVVPRGTGYNGICPGHDDREASLGVTEVDDRLLVRCYAGCDTKDVLDKMGLSFSDLFLSSVNYNEPEATYDYVNEEGEVLFQTVRLPGKNFRQRHLEGEEWVWNLDGVRRVLYRLPEVMQAVREGRAVYLVEGEKDVEALRALGHTATCNPMGAGKWRDEYNEWLRGALVYIIQDRDEPGRRHAENVRDGLVGIASAIYVLQAKVGKDISDHLAAGFTGKDLVPVRAKVRRGILTANELADRALEDLQLNTEDMPGYVLNEAVPLTFRQGRMYAIGGYTGDGKTTYVIGAARKLAEEGRHVTYFTLEMPERDLKNVLIAHKGIPLHELEEPWKLRQNPEYDRLYKEAVEEWRHWNLDLVFETAALDADAMVEIVRERESEVVIIDHIHRMSWGEERRKFESEIAKLTNMALDLNVMVVLVCQLREPRQYGKDILVYPMPTLQSFKETGVIGNDAAIALAVWRQRDDGGQKYVGTTMVLVLKNRHTTGKNDDVGRQFFVQYDYATRRLVGHKEEIPDEQQEEAAADTW
jgi:KaiC/GvpD/RAD55 family RecA-like ATPase